MIVEEDSFASCYFGQPWKAAHDAVEGINEGLRLMLAKQLPEFTRASQTQMALIIE